MNGRFERFCSLLLVMLAMTSNGYALSAQALQQGIPSLAPMLTEVTPAVVSIRVTKTLPSANQFNFERGQIPQELRRYFNFQFPDEIPAPPQGRGNRSVGSGSGVIVNAAAGYIITNHHVVDGADEIMVTLHDRRNIAARLLGSDERTDIALLQIQASDLMGIAFADSDSAQVGDFVVAIGNPFGIGQTVTAGIVSALGRAGLNNENYEDFIQTDAAINVGNSGGALVDMEGRLVGINSAIISSSGGGSNGIGFAVPANMVAAVMEHLVRDGEVRRGMLGVQISDLTPEIAATLQLTRQDGALVTTVLPGSAAEAAGIQVYDVITAIDANQINSGRELRNVVGLLGLDQEVEVTVLRDSRELKVMTRIGSGQEVAVSDATRPDDNTDFKGAKLRNVESMQPQRGVEVVNVGPESPAELAGLQAGDVILEVNRASVTDLAAFNRAVNDTAGLLALTVARNEQRMIVMLR